MEEVILIAGADKIEVDLLSAALRDEFAVETLVAPNRLVTDPRKYSFILLDQNFTEFRSLDTLMYVLTGNKIPVMVMSCGNAERDINEALNMGACSFLIKQGDFTQMLGLKVRHVIDTFGEITLLKERVNTLKIQMKELEEEITRVSLPGSYVVRGETILRQRR